MIELKTDIHTEIARQKQLYQAFMESVQPQTRAVFTEALMKKTSKIFIVGCGDSLFAAQGARMFFEEATGMQVEPMEGMEFSRYFYRNAPLNSMLLAVSNSGRVSRLVEAAICARKQHIKTFALTGNTDRPLAQNSDIVITGALPNIRASIDSMSARVTQKEQDALFERLSEPGMLSVSAEKLGMGNGLDFLLFMLGAYNNSLMLLYCSAIAIGLARHHINQQQAAKYYAQILASVEAQVRTAYANLEAVIETAHELINKDAFVYLGSGPAYAAASLSAAKLFEQPHLNGVAQYMEEWAHLQFFFTRPDGIPIFALVPPGVSRSRALEQIAGINALGGLVYAVCAADDGTVISQVKRAFTINGNVNEAFAPWVYGVPGQLLAVTLFDLRGQPPIPAPFSFKQMMQVNFKQIYASQIEE